MRIEKADGRASSVLRAAMAILMASSGATAPSVAVAQEQSDAEARDPVGLAEIVVTARKRDENVSKIPETVSVLTADTVEQAGVRDVGGIAQLTPNVSFRNDQEVGVSTLTIRGVSQVRNGEPPVAFVVDGVQAANSLVTTQELYDVQQIEVLKGPQGALYGRNAIAGAINITTREPTNEPDFAVRLGYGDGQDYSAGFSTSGAIVDDKLLFRVAGNVRDREGQLRNITLDDYVDFYEHRSGRARLLWFPTDALTVDLRATVSRTQGGGGYYMPTEVSPLNGPDTVRRISGDSIATTNVDFESFSLKVDWDLPLGTLSSVTSHDDVRAPNSISDDPRERYDIDNAIGSFINVSVHDDSKTLTQELRMTSPAERRVRYVAGVFYQDQKRDRLFDVYGNLTFFTTGNPDREDAVWVQLAANRQELRTESVGVFAQVNVDLTDALELTLAGRYDRDKKRDLAPSPELERTFSKFQPKVSLAYELSDRTLAYATYAVGFRTGGFNNTDTFGKEYAPEELDSYEVGLKTSWAEQRVTLNAAAFYLDYANLQTFLFDNINGTQAIVNYRESVIQGFELEVAAQPWAGLLLQGGIGYNDGELRKLGQVPGLQIDPTEYDGNTIKNMPEWTLNLTAQYTARLGIGGELITRFDYQHSGRTYWELDNVDSQGAYGILNARMTYARNDWSVTGYVNNVTDKKYDVYFFAKEFVGALVDIAWPSAPRQAGIEFKYRF